MARHKSRVRHTRRRRSSTRSRKQAGGIKWKFWETNAAEAPAPATAPVTEAPKEAPKESLGNRFMNFFKTEPAEAEAPKPAAGGGRRKKSRKHHRRRHRK